ncbi:hypothetical protein LOD99_4520 [Oopsacas minuta]|uniref:Nucleoside diphosphate kinase-like domain-containing protein n=1 Tax=Oopsacas minuta TaxID=111878 RepID=A0AAV7JTD3_9METZ|nr:hypothetical protein LOD99_4520 [Oopsacas minuta]
MSTNKIKQITLAILKPEIVQMRLKTEAVFERIHNEGFEIVQQRTFQFSPAQAKRFYYPKRSKFYFKRCIRYIITGPVIACILSKHNAIEDFSILVKGKEGCRENSLRARFASNETMNAIHCSDTQDDVRREIRLIFPNFNHEPWYPKYPE